MSKCRNQEMAYGEAWPRSCPTCGLAGNCTQMSEQGVEAAKAARPQYANLFIAAARRPIQEAAPSVAVLRREIPPRELDALRSAFEKTMRETYGWSNFKRTTDEGYEVPHIQACWFATRCGWLTGASAPVHQAADDSLSALRAAPFSEPRASSEGELPARPVAMELAGVAEQIDEGNGFWRSCTGPRSAIVRCALGNGCSECGGIGAVWDDTDYDAMADFMAQQDAAPLQGQPAPDLAGVLEALEKAKQHIDDLTTLYAEEFCDEEQVKAAAARIYETGQLHSSAVVVQGLCAAITALRAIEGGKTQ